MIPFVKTFPTVERFSDHHLLCAGRDILNAASSALKKMIWKLISRTKPLPNTYPLRLPKRTDDGGAVGSIATLGDCAVLSGKQKNVAPVLARMAMMPKSVGAPEMPRAVAHKQGWWSRSQPLLPPRRFKRAEEGNAKWGGLSVMPPAWQRRIEN
ncbi:hypothetical protein [Phyllobacterium bourgognense]|uniref:Uncharacterized protein n=1 Tax=Phyllobacterium bourgognense TaxID=314236 RepID=A0A368YVZ0_9HYPH|nr:hypothetical protein [Phyllobacterium bourgognense]RCW83799.1 hypothetical protein C7476_105295 [Phyllobacterium bourgognense]